MHQDLQYKSDNMVITIFTSLCVCSETPPQKKKKTKEKKSSWLAWNLLCSPGSQTQWSACLRLPNAEIEGGHQYLAYSFKFSVTWNRMSGLWAGDSWELPGHMAEFYWDPLRHVPLPRKHPAILLLIVHKLALHPGITSVNFVQPGNLMKGGTKPLSAQNHKQNLGPKRSSQPPSFSHLTESIPCYLLELDLVLHLGSMVGHQGSESFFCMGSVTHSAFINFPEWSVT